MEIGFCELRTKIVVNLVDGRKLGHVIDLIFDQHTAKVLGIVVPGTKGSGINVFKPREDIFIPFHQICRIGADTILVEIGPPIPNTTCILNAPEEKQENNNPYEY